MKRFEKPGSLSTEQYKKNKAVGNRPGILFGLCKVHKAITDVCPSFRPLLSTTETEDVIEDINKSEFKNLLSLATQE